MDQHSPVELSIRPRSFFQGFALLLLMSAVVVAIVPFNSLMPAAGLDNSWMFAMNQAVVRGMTIGRDIVFTFGPYASLYSKVYEPALDKRMLLAGMLVALQCCIGLSRLAGRRGAGTLLMLLVACLWLSYSMDALLIFSVLLVGLYAWELTVQNDSAETPPDDGLATMLACAIVFASLGLLTLMKVTFIALAGPMFVLSVVGLVWHRRKRLALSACAGYVVGTLFFWLLAGQSLTLIVKYLAGSVDLISGYADAMSLPGDPVEVLLYWLAAIALCVGCITAPGSRRAARVWLLSVSFLVLFTASKSGFSRQDFHATIAGAVVILTALTLRLVLLTPVVVTGILLAAGTAFYIDANAIQTSTRTLSVRATTLYSAGWRGLVDHLGGSPALRLAYASAIEQLRQEKQYPALDGTTDVYSFDQAHLLVSTNRWSPRPVFQSYAVYNPKLAELNRQHLINADAPDHLIVRVEAIDGHFPLMEDGPSWLEMLARYQPATIADDVLYLSKRNVVLPSLLGSTMQRDANLEETIELPNEATATFARIDIHTTWLGRLADFIYRIDPLRLRVTLRDGSVHVYRLVAGMARSGFLVSPLIENAHEAALLYSPHALASKDVRSFAVLRPEKESAFENLFYDSRYSLALSPISGDDAVDLTVALSMVKPAASVPAIEASWADCLGSVDLVNDQRDLSNTSADRVLKVDGWMDQGSSQVPTRDAFITLSASGEAVRYLPTKRTSRPDVAAYLKRSELTEAGVQTVADASDLAGHYIIGLAYRTQGRLVRCRQFAIPLDVRH